MHPKIFRALGGSLSIYNLNVNFARALFPNYETIHLKTFFCYGDIRWKFDINIVCLDCDAIICKYLGKLPLPPILSEQGPRSGLFVGRRTIFGPPVSG